MQVGDMKHCCWLGAKHVALLHALCVLGLSVGNVSGEAGVPRSRRLRECVGGGGGVGVWAGRGLGLVSGRDSEG